MCIRDRCYKGGSGSSKEYQYPSLHSLIPNYRLRCHFLGFLSDYMYIASFVHNFSTALLFCVPNSTVILPDVFGLKFTRHCSFKTAFHDAVIDSDTDILARILADMSDTRDFLKLFQWQAERHADILASQECRRRECRRGCRCRHRGMRASLILSV